MWGKTAEWLRQAASKYILKRKWIEAEILPYILWYVGITTLLDPALSAAVAALGLYLREGNPLEDLHQLGNDGRCSNSRQRAVVQDLINMWHSYVLFEEIFSALTTRAGTPAQIIANLKKVTISGMVREAKSRLPLRSTGRVGKAVSTISGWFSCECTKKTMWRDCQIHAP